MKRPDGSRAGAAAIAMALALAVAGLAAVLADSLGEPYLSADSVNLGIVLFAVALFSALFAMPFAIQGRVIRAMERREQGSSGTPILRDRAWERSLMIWGAACLALMVLGAIVGFDTDTLGGALSAVAAVIAGLVVATLAVHLDSG